MIRCIVPDCSRARVLARDGWSYPMCSAHTCEALTDAFGGSWHERAASHTLPPRVSGGLPTNHDALSGADALPPGIDARQAGTV